MIGIGKGKALDLLVLGLSDLSAQALAADRGKLGIAKAQQEGVGL